VAGGTFVALAALTAEPVDLSTVVTDVVVDCDHITVRWADGPTTRITLDPVTVG
jgi:hypothetical protein